MRIYSLSFRKKKIEIQAQGTHINIEENVKSLTVENTLDEKRWREPIAFCLSKQYPCV